MWAEVSQLNLLNHKYPPAILFVDHASGLGGAEHSLLLLLKHLRLRAWNINLACPAGRLADQAGALGVPIHILSLPRLRRSLRFASDWIKGAQAIARLARQVEANLLVANTVRAAVYCALPARMYSIPFFWHMRDFWLSETKPRHIWFDMLGKTLLSRASVCIIANSKATARHLPDGSKVEVVYNGIEAGDYEPRAPATLFRQHYQIPLQVPLVGMAARLRPWKGQERFLQMAAQVLNEGSQAHFLLIGGDPFGDVGRFEHHLNEFARDQGLSEHVTFTGHLEDIRPALSALDVFVHPGNPEPFGRVIIEAMASGKPVVAFSHGAAPEIVEHGRTGILVKPGSQAELVKGTITLLKDPAKGQVMGAYGRKRVQSHFSIQHTVSRTAEIYEQAISLAAGSQ